jgi:hypothetical protein
LFQFDLSVLQSENSEEESYWPGGAIHAILWGRDTSATTVAEFLRRVDADFLISGHVPCPQGFEFASDIHLILDSMASPAGYCMFQTECLPQVDVMKACVGTV